MTRERLFEQIRTIILAANSTLLPADVIESASLTADLGMDSLHLESLIAAVQAEIADVEFTPWYVQTARRGQDTVGGLVDYIAARTGSAVLPAAPGGTQP